MKDKKDKEKLINEISQPELNKNEIIHQEGFNPPKMPKPPNNNSNGNKSDSSEKK